MIMIQNVLIVQKKHDLVRILALYPDIRFCYLGDNRAGYQEILGPYSGHEVPLDYSESRFNQDCVEAYLDLLGNMSRKNSSIFWWATFTSSKNRFVSRLLSDLFAFRSVIRILNSETGPVFLIIDPPSGITRSLEKYCNDRNISLEKVSPGGDDLTSRIRTIIEPWKASLQFVVSTWGKILIARLLFSGVIRRRAPLSGSTCIVRTWAYDRSIDGQQQYHDAFFGVLPEFIQKQKNLVIIAGIIGSYPKIAYRLRGVNNFTIIPQEYFLHFSDPVRALRAVRKNGVTVSGEVSYLGSDVSDILQEALYQDNTRHVPLQYLYSCWAKRMQKVFHPEIFTTTYENNPWEKVCFITLKENDPRIKIIGYQHAVLSQSSLNMMINPLEINSLPIPDLVITIGNVTKDFLETRGSYPPERLKTGCGLRFVQSQKTISPRERDNPLRILVALEGGLSESVNLVSFIFHALKEQSGVKIIIRSHPELPFDMFSGYLDVDISRYPHFVCSHNTRLQDDLDECDILIYRGSSVAVDALNRGVSLIHIRQRDILSVDPLFGNSWLKWVAEDEAGLKNAIAEIDEMTAEEYMNAVCEARNYLKQYFYEVTEERMQVFLPS